MLVYVLLFFANLYFVIVFCFYVLLLGLCLLFFIGMIIITFTYVCMYAYIQR